MFTSNESLIIAHHKRAFDSGQQWKRISRRSDKKYEELPSKIINAIYEHNGCTAATNEDCRGATRKKKVQVPGKEENFYCESGSRVFDAVILRGEMARTIREQNVFCHALCLRINAIFIHASSPLEHLSTLPGVEHHPS